jgi:adenylylsulfate kinase-like enzyme
MNRDPKGIYRKSREGTSGAVPGVQAVYEPPLNPDVTVQCEQEPIEASARRVIEKLKEKGFISSERT